MLWAAGVILVGEVLLAISFRRSVRSLGAYTEKLETVHHQNIDLRRNIAIERNEEAISYIIDNPTEKEA